MLHINLVFVAFDHDYLTLSRELPKTGSSSRGMVNLRDLEHDVSLRNLQWTVGLIFSEGKSYTRYLQWGQTLLLSNYYRMGHTLQDNTRQNHLH